MAIIASSDDFRLYDDGKLEITAYGSMPARGWGAYTSRIYTVIIYVNTTTISNNAFKSCFNLTDVKIPDTVRSIGSEAFQSCHSLTDVKIPDSVRSIGERAFEDCISLTSVAIPDGVTNIENYTFSNCTNLDGIKIPGSVTNIGSAAFYNCANLSDVYYAGTRAQWEAINIGISNSPLASATIHYNYAPPIEPVPEIPVTGLRNPLAAVAQTLNLLIRRILGISVPTKTSDLTNDSGYLTSEELPAIPANVSAFTNDAGYLTEHQDISGKLDASRLGAANGVAELDSSGKVPSAQLPAYVDDVLEYASASAFPATGETGKIYVAVNTNLTYRWSGSAYVEISPSLALGETSSTAYRGDRGKIAYDHSQTTSGNPHNVTKSDVGLGNVDNTSDANKPVSTPQQAALDLKVDKDGMKVLSDNNYTTEEKNAVAAIGNKVDKVAGKGLSTNDFTDALKDKLSGIESGATATAIDAALSNSGQAADAKATGDALDVLRTENALLRELLQGVDAPIYRDASGNPATFTDGAAANVKSLSVEIVPLQSGSGDPYPPGGGKNLLPLSANFPVTKNGITVTKNADGSITVNGTATNNTQITLSANYSLPADDYILTGTPSGWGGDAQQLRVFFNVGSMYKDDMGNGVSFTLTESSAYCYCILVVSNGVSVSNLTLYPMIRLASDTDPTFAPYSNVRPISGVSSVTVTRTGKNLIQNNHTGGDPFTHSGVTYTLQEDGGILMNGTATGNSRYYFTANNRAVSLESAGLRKGQRLTLSGVPDGFPAWIDFVLYNGTTYTYLSHWIKGNGSAKVRTFTLPEDVEYDSFAVYIRINEGDSVSNALAYPMLRFADVDDETFEPYNGQAVTVPLVDSNSNPLTVYGGTLEVTSGTLSVTWANIASYAGETLPGRWISDRDVYASGTTPTTGAQVVYELAAPVTYNLTAAQLASLAGYNSVSADAGSVSVTYKADTSITLGGG